MLASTLLPEQEEQHQEQLKDLQQQQGPIGRRQQAAYAQVRASCNLPAAATLSVHP